MKDFTSKKALQAELKLKFEFLRLSIASPRTMHDQATMLHTIYSQRAISWVRGFTQPKPRRVCVHIPAAILGQHSNTIPAPPADSRRAQGTEKQKNDMPLTWTSWRLWHPELCQQPFLKPSPTLWGVNGLVCPFLPGWIIYAEYLHLHLQVRTERLPAGFLGKLTLTNWSPSHLLTPARQAFAGSLEAGACSAHAGGASPGPGRGAQPGLCGQRGSPGRRAAAAAARSPSAPPARPGRRCCGGQGGTTPAAPHGSSLRCDASPRCRYLSEERKNPHE